MTRLEMTAATRERLVQSCRVGLGFLDLLEKPALLLGRRLQHASLEARLAILQSRVMAGASSEALTMAFEKFATEYDSFVRDVAP
jgi:hypothetical protein